MNRVPAGTELACPFLPAKDFDRSKRFYEAIGFEKTSYFPISDKLQFGRVLSHAETLCILNGCKGSTYRAIFERVLNCQRTHRLINHSTFSNILLRKNL